MNNKLNEEYFKTKKEYQERLKRNKFNFKRGFINVLITFLLIFVFNGLYKSCNKKIEENRLKFEKSKKLC